MDEIAILQEIAKGKTIYDEEYDTHRCPHCITTTTRGIERFKWLIEFTLHADECVVMHARTLLKKRYGYSFHAYQVTYTSTYVGTHDVRKNTTVVAAFSQDDCIHAFMQSEYIQITIHSVEEIEATEEQLLLMLSSQA